MVRQPLKLTLLKIIFVNVFFSDIDSPNPAIFIHYKPAAFLYSFLHIGRSHMFVIHFHCPLGIITPAIGMVGYTCRHCPCELV